jgi:hypothetical protein
MSPQQKAGCWGIIFLLLLSSCASATKIAVSTPIPSATSTSTGTPSPTTTPTPEPTGFQVGSNGNVQEFKNGKWVDINTPKGMWTQDFEDGHSVIEGDQLFYQMELKNGFTDSDGNSHINVAKFNQEKRGWENIPFQLTRSAEAVQQLVDIFDSHFDLTNTNIGMPIKRVEMNAKIIGIESKVNDDKNASIEFLFLFKDKVFRSQPGLIMLEKTFPDDFHREPVVPGEMNLNQVLELLNIANQTETTTTSKADTHINWDIVPNSATVADCEKGSVPGLTPKVLVDWCKSQVEKGNSRTIPQKDVIEMKVLHGDGPVRLEENVQDLDTSDLWNKVGASPIIDGAFEYAWIGVRP